MSFSLGVRLFGRNPIPQRRTIQRGIDAAVDKAVKRAQSLMRTHSQGYTGGFDIDIIRDSDGVEVSTDDERVGFVSDGTKAHVIRSRSGGSLAFSSNYVAKTTPSTIPTRPGGPSGSTVFAKEVMHPGIAVPRLDLAVADEVAPEFLRDIEEVLTWR